MVHHWKALNLEIIDSEYHHNVTSLCESMLPQTSNLKHVEFIKVSDKLTYDTSLESS